MSENFIWIQNNILGYCVDIHEVYKHIAMYQIIHHFSFELSEMDQDFSNIDVNSKKRTLYWSSEDCTEMENVQLSFDGVPFFVLGKAVYNCQEYEKNCKRKADGSDACSTSAQCPAKIIIFELVKFPMHKIKTANQSVKDNMIQKLSADLSVGKALAERRFYVFFPKISDHQNHLIDRSEIPNPPFTVDIDATDEDEVDACEVDITDTIDESNSSAKLMERCTLIVDKIRERTFTCDEMTLAYGHIILKDALSKLNRIKEHGLRNPSSSNS